MRVFLVLLLLAAPAWADDTEPAITSHKGQFGVSARFGLGVRAIVTYSGDRPLYCGKSDASQKGGFAAVCTGRTPLALDLEAAYGVADSIELTLELGIGIESDFGSAPGSDGPHPLTLAPGARFFFSEAKHSKLFVQPSLVLDFASYAQAPSTDIGLKGIEGFWMDLHKSYGLYFFISEQLEFRRWMSGDFEAGLGFQGRYP